MVCRFCSKAWPGGGRISGLVVRRTAPADAAPPGFAVIGKRSGRVYGTFDTEAEALHFAGDPLRRQRRVVEPALRDAADRLASGSAPEAAPGCAYCDYVARASAAG